MIIQLTICWGIELKFWVNLFLHNPIQDYEIASSNIINNRYEI